MGTYTPNLNLYKPDPNDNFEDFLPEFNTNMDILDGGGGGGSGGHTIIDPLGQDMPQRTGLQFIGATVTDDSANDKTVVTITGGGGGSVNYSLTEQVIGTWIDGKPLYERTINCGALGNGTHNIETLTVEEVKFIKGFVVDPNDASYMRPLPFPADSANTIRVDVQNNVLRIITFSSWSGYSAYLTIQYTKTTD